MIGTGVYGLRSVRAYKLYRKNGAYFASYKHNNTLRRMQLKNRAQALALAHQPESTFVESINQLLDAGQQTGSPDYYER